MAEIYRVSWDEFPEENCALFKAESPEDAVNLAKQDVTENFDPFMVAMYGIDIDNMVAEVFDPENPGQTQTRWYGDVTDLGTVSVNMDTGEVMSNR